MLRDPAPPRRAAAAGRRAGKPRASRRRRRRRHPISCACSSDGEARIRRRAALAIGRVGLREGVPPLVALLADPDPEVRQMAAFALGLIGDPRRRDAAGRARCDDPSPLVQGSAAEALGLIGDRAAADADRPDGWQRSLQSGALAQPPGDDDDGVARYAGGRVPARAVRARPAQSVRPARGRRARRRGSRACAGGRSPTRCSGSRIRAPCPRC